MIPLLGRDAVRAVDEDAVERLGLPSIVLMENAGLGAYRVLVERFGDALGRVVVLGGVGQNGGDGWVVARHLANEGVTVAPVLCGARAKVKGDAAVNLGALEALGVRVHEESGKIHPVFGPDLDLAALAAVVSHLDLLVTNDSGPMHLAAALGVRCVALFGPTDPRFFGPYPLKSPTNYAIQAPVGDLNLLSAKEVFYLYNRIEASLQKAYGASSLVGA